MKFCFGKFASCYIFVVLLSLLLISFNVALADNVTNNSTAANNTTTNITSNNSTAEQEDDINLYGARWVYFVKTNASVSSQYANVEAYSVDYIKQNKIRFDNFLINYFFQTFGPHAVIESYDSELDFENATYGARDDVKDKLVVLNVVHWTFNNTIHYGQIVVNIRMLPAARMFFYMLFNNHYPIRSVIPTRHFNDNLIASMEADNTVGFAPYDKDKLMSQGLTISFNPMENPDMSKVPTFPFGAHYNTDILGSLAEDNLLIDRMATYGLVWLGKSEYYPNYMRFEFR